MAKTVAAISTPLGEGGLSVIRISGDDAITVADRCFRAFSGKSLKSLNGYEAAYGEIISGGSVIDDAVALVFKAPKSYTGENTVEFSLHGGLLITRTALRAVLSSGAVLAEGGEFTKRAFLNGKIDLAKAESVAEIISARNDAALKISRAARQGRISCEIEGICEKLLETAASLAAYADYPDEDIEGLDFDNFSRLLCECEAKTERLLSTYDAGKVLREGIDCAIVGKPNVGKSTLMNLLCGSDRSIVTEVAGTTRDIIENTVNLGDITLNIADTAGIRQTDDTVEKVGVELALKRLGDAAVILCVFDLSRELDGDDLALIEKIKDKKAVIILNKTDLSTKFDKTVFGNLPTVEISAKQGVGLEALTKAVSTLVKTENISPDDAVLISERQRDCTARAFEAIKEAKQTLLCGFTLDAVGVCVDDAIAALLELTGKRVTNEVCDEVFKRFCVGK